MGKFSRLSVLKKPKVLTPLIIVLVLISVVALAVHNLNAPAVGTISQTPPAKTEVIDPYAQPGQYNGKYISFTYPAHYKRVPSQKTGNLLEVVDFFATNQTSKQLSIGVLKENISDDTGLSFRRQHPDIYQEQPRNKNGIVQFVSTTNGSERTAFVPDQDKVANIAFSAPPGWDLSEDMQTVLTSLRWK